MILLNTSTGFGGITANGGKLVRNGPIQGERKMKNQGLKSSLGWEKDTQPLDWQDSGQGRKNR